MSEEDAVESFAKAARDAIIQSLWDRRVFIVFPADDQFPSQGYTFSQLNSYLEMQSDFWSLNHLDGVDLFHTSENTDFASFRQKVTSARERGSVIVLVTNDPMDTVFLQKSDHVVFYGDERSKSQITKTNNVHQAANFQEAAEFLAWIRYDLETSRERTSTPSQTRNIDWSQYPDAPHMLH